MSEPSRQSASPRSPVPGTPATDVLRARRNDRFERLVAAGRALMREHGTQFTVPDVARTARTSLRAFYECFSNKDELLFVVFQRAIEEAAEGLTAAIDAHDDPRDQLQAYVQQLFRNTFADEHPEMAPMIELHLQLATENPAGLAHILQPQNDVLVDVLRRGVEMGVFRDDIAVESLALLVSQTLITAVHSRALGSHLMSGQTTVDDVWSYCLGAVTPLPDRT